MTAAHWLILAAAAVATVLCLWWTRRQPRIRGVDAAEESCDCGAWRRWRITRKLSKHLYMSGLAVGGGGYVWGGGGHSGCLSSVPVFRWGERPYVLWVKWGTWRCLLRGGPNGRHRPADQICWGYCSKCLPCPDCGSQTAGHTDDCPMVRPRQMWQDEPGDPTHEQIDQALDIATEVDRAKADHVNAAMRSLEHTVPWPHLTAEEAADCTICSPSSLPRRTEGEGGHD